LSTLTASIDLAPTAPSITAARHVVLELLRVWGTPQDRDDAALLVTELVANVVDHVGGEASLTLELTSSEGWLRIAVRDGSSVRPVVQELSQERPRGRGLRMVRAIADRWGSEDHQGGKRVWFELGPAQDT
jgi:anti-sigma regulatory factor (Ser/Thr protein kinase)